MPTTVSGVLRFLTTRRWLVRILAGLALAAACVWLGMWQLDRNEQRQARNAVIEANLDRPAVAIDDVLAPDTPLAAGDEWTGVRVSGRYDVENQLVLRMRPRAGQPGVHVLTPLLTGGGAAVLVDRGFVAAAGAEVPDLPPPPAGTVEVTGRVRPSEAGRGPGGDPGSGSIRYVDLAAIGAQLPYPLYGGWLELAVEDPPSPAAPEPVPPPEIESGPHLSYAIQWFAFATIGVGGFVFLVRAEAKVRREDEARLSAEPVDETRVPQSG
jgi:cytochrome oxidase assembly protein ShyY1